MGLASLSRPLNKTTIHYIRYYLMHQLVIWYTYTMICYIPLTWIIIHCEPWSNRFRIFSIYFESNTIPIFAWLCVLFNPTFRSSRLNFWIKAFHITSTVKIILWQSKGKTSFYSCSWYTTWTQNSLGVSYFHLIHLIGNKHPFKHDATFLDFDNQNLIFSDS